VARALQAPLDVFLIRKLGAPGHEELAMRPGDWSDDARRYPRALRQRRPAHIVVAVPTASPDTCEALGVEADKVVCAVTPRPSLSLGHWYDDFTQPADQQVRRLLAQRQQPEAGRPSPSATDTPSDAVHESHLLQ
jgi:predicted phosphoribosyltransferase